jgi:micrococcal nuclease
MYEYNAKIVYVVDGDTVDAEVDLGLDISTKIRLRLYGIDTPERGQPGYNEAKLYVINAVLNKTVLINTYKDETEKYGRYLALIRLDKDSVDLNTQLINEGLAKPYFGGKKE